MTIIEDKEQKLQAELSKSKHVKKLFNEIHKLLEHGKNYDEIFKQAFILNDEEGIVSYAHIMTAMKLIRDHTTQGKVFYSYFEKRWLKSLDIYSSLTHWEIPDNISHRLINSLSRLIVELNNSTFQEDKLQLAESISKVKIYINIINKYIDKLLDDQSLSTMVSKFEHFYTIKLADIIEIEEIEEQLQEIEYL